MEMTMDLDDFIADGAAFVAAEAKRHFGDRYAHYVIGADAAIYMEHPEGEDFQGNPTELERILKEPGCEAINLGREYHVPPGYHRDVYKIRNMLIRSQ